MAKIAEKEKRGQSLLEEACKIVYLNYGRQTAQLYKAGLKDKAEKEIFQSLEQSLKELVGPANAEEQLKGVRETYGHLE